MAKVHIGKGGIVRPCIAQPGNCPYGGAEAHWENAEDARFVADDINRQLANISGFGIAKHGDYATPNRYTEQAILRMANLDAKVDRLEKFAKKARAEILGELKAKGIKTLDTEQIRATWVAGGTRRGIDSEAFYADTSIDHSQFTAESDVKSHLRDENEDVKTKKWLKANGEELPTFEFKIKDKNGEYSLDTDAQKSVDNLRELETSLTNARQAQRDIKENIHSLMVENDVRELRVGRIKYSNIAASTRTRVDVKALRAADKYDDYVKESITSDSLRLKFKEEKPENKPLN